MKPEDLSHYVLKVTSRDMPPPLTCSVVNFAFAVKQEAIKHNKKHDTTNLDRGLSLIRLLPSRSLKGEFPPILL